MAYLGFKVGEHTEFDVNVTVSKCRRSFHRLGPEDDVDSRRLPLQGVEERHRQTRQEEFGDLNRERPFDGAGVELDSRTQDLIGLPQQRVERIADFRRTLRGNETLPGANQKRVAGQSPQSRQRPTDCRRRRPQPVRGHRDAALLQQCVKNAQQVQVHRYSPLRS